MLDVKKRKIARLAFQEARDRGIDGLRLETLAETTGLPLPLLVSLYPQGEGELCMDAVEYAGELWRGWRPPSEMGKRRRTVCTD